MNKKNKISKGFWIWGQFDRKSTEQITNLHKKINNILHGPNFDIHITLSGPITHFEETHKSKLVDLSNSFSPIKIQLNGIGMKEQFFQSLFIDIKENYDLKNFKKGIDDKFSLYEKKYFPHISLYYGDARKDSKIKSVDEFKLVDEIILDKISIVAVDEEIKSWSVLKSYSLFQSVTVE